METGVSVAEAMTTKPVMTRPATTIRDCARLMNEYDVGSVLLEDNGELIGIVTENDLTRKVVAEGLDTKEPVKTIAETALVTIHSHKDLTEALEVMKKNDIRHLPVLEGDEFAGYITLQDILKIAPALFEVVVNTLRLREEERKPVDTE